MNLIDYGMGVIVLISVWMGWQRGFMKEIGKLCIWSLAILTGWHFSEHVAHFLPAVVNPSIRKVISYSVLLTIMLVLGNFGTYFLSQRDKKINLTAFDRWAGMGLGIVRGVIILSILIMLTGLTSVSEQMAWQESNLRPVFQSLIRWLMTESLA